MDLFTPNRLVFIGLGGIGSWIVEPAIRYFKNCRKVLLIDGDVVEQKNLERQSFSSDVMNSYKAEALRRRLRSVFPHLVIEAHNVFIDATNVKRYLANNDVVLVSPDNHAARRTVSKMVKTLDTVAVFTAGNELFDGSCHCYLRLMGVEMTKDFISRHPEAIDVGSTEREGCGALLDLGAVQLIAVNFLMAALMLMAVHQTFKYGSPRSEKEAWSMLPQELYGSILTGKVRTALINSHTPEEVAKCS